MSYHLGGIVCDNGVAGLAMIHKFFVALGIRLLPQDCVDSLHCRKFLSRLVCQ